MRSVLSLALALLVFVPARSAAADVPSLLRALEGGWAGQATSTPEGPMPFALLFESQPDGGLHARTTQDPETFIDLRFTKQADGSWQLVESAGLPGLGVQSHPLVLAAAPAPGITRFVTPANPEFMHVDFRVTPTSLGLEVSLRGMPHAAFELARVPEAELPRLRAALAGAPAAASEAPAEAEAPALDALIAQADAAPGDAQAQLRLGRGLMAELSANPAAGFRLGGQAVKALRSAAALDPALAEPHQLLAIYHLHAPAIGGGSKEKALAEARRYAELDPVKGPGFLAEMLRAAAE